MDLQPETNIGDVTPLQKKPKKLIWILPIAIVMILALFLASGYIYISTFTKSANITNQEFAQILKNGNNKDLFEKVDSYNLLLLGLDQVGISRDNSLLTDTIIIANIQSSGQITLLPIPRDLWIDPLKTKINSLYYYGEKNPDISGEQLVKMSLEEIFDIQIDYTVTINLSSVEKIINSIGGVNVLVEEAFTDDNYPRDDVDPNILPIELRYKTISFDEGVQHMDGARAMEYIRSRKSSNQQENTDEARSVRQQKIIYALIEKLTNKQSLLTPKIYGNMYILWHELIKTNLNDEDLVAFAKAFTQVKPKIRSINIPIKNATSEGIIYNPPIWKRGQWVYEPVDASWSEFKNFFLKELESVN